MSVADTGRRRIWLRVRDAVCKEGLVFVWFWLLACIFFSLNLVLCRLNLVLCRLLVALLYGFWCACFFCFAYVQFAPISCRVSPSRIVECRAV